MNNLDKMQHTTYLVSLSQSLPQYNRCLVDMYHCICICHTCEVTPTRDIQVCYSLATCPYNIL